MKIPFRAFLLSGILSLTLLPAKGSEYFVAADGNDANPGSEALPWRTIQKAVNTVLPGDTAIVRAGDYDERITTARGGTNEASRITFLAEGKVNMRGWIINHAYITVNGFDITGHSANTIGDAYVRVNGGGSNFELLSCRLRDGIGIARTDMYFTAPDKISSPSGGFLDAGFSAGQRITLTRATNVNLLNSGSFTIASMSDTSITVASSTIVDDGPKPGYITGSASYGIYLEGGAQDAVISGNVFSNLSYVYGFVAGRGHLLEQNILERNNGWDLLLLAGTNHIFRGNWFRNNGWGTYQPSADVFDNWPIRYENIHFTNNYVESLIGVINAQKNNPTVSGPLYITSNVFVDVGWLSLVMPNTTIQNNTFLRVAKQNNAAVALAKHPVTIQSSNYATNAVIRNNIFVDCGQRTFPYTEADMGWYQINGPTNSLVAEGNFVAGGPPGYGIKIGWLEDPNLNGGNPGFVNINDPLGPDGLPFTDDDGLRPLPTSRLVGGGGGWRDNWGLRSSGWRATAPHDPTIRGKPVAAGMAANGGNLVAPVRTSCVWRMDQLLANSGSGGRSVPRHPWRDQRGRILPVDSLAGSCKVGEDNWRK